MENLNANPQNIDPEDGRPGRMVEDQFKGFLETFQRDGRFEYREQLNLLRQNDQTTFIIDLEDVRRYDEGLYGVIKQNYYRLMPNLHKAASRFAQEATQDEEDGLETYDYWVSFFSTGKDEHIQKIRDLRTDCIGKLTSIRGTVTRTSDVRPELIMGTFQCVECSTVIKDVVQQFTYTEPTVCTNPQCTNRKNFVADPSQCKFVDWQRVRVQEDSSEIPSGSMPRSIHVVLRNETVDRAKPGDKVVFTGTLVVVPDVRQMSKNGGGGRQNDGNGVEGVTGLKVLGMRDMNYKLMFLACTVQTSSASDTAFDIREANTAQQFMENLTDEERATLRRMHDDERLYHHMVESICPQVFGHENIKRGVLLMLLGGVHKKTLENTNIRGDINVCIVGDPSVAKSQFLKFVADFLPRAIYTSGKASSAAGLTASVVKDEDTQEFCIEAGALMLADNGICCIDEFDKMDIKDQIAIHEAMEQQTISIAKAGIKATLNAATSILAACNPIGGRYDLSKPLRYNIQMSNAIMSRFDLFFIVTDDCSEVSDYNIARHIVMNRVRDTPVETPYTKEEMQMYIAYARTLNPMLTKEAEELIPQIFVQLRQNSKSSNGSMSDRSYPITVRQLESLIRLSEALARLHLDTQIRTTYVRHAFKLLDDSVLNLVHNDITLDMDAALKEQGDLYREGTRVIGENETDNAFVKKPDASEQQAQSRTISYDDYRRIARELVHRLHINEVQAQADAVEKGEDAADIPGITRDDLAAWYIEEHSDELESQEEALETADLIRRIISRLVNKEKLLVERKLRRADVMEEDGAEDEEDEVVYLFVSPNVDVTSINL